MLMSEFHYPKPKRLPVGKRIEGKEYLSKEDLEWLFKSRLIIEEKMDGRQTFFYNDKYIFWCEDMLRKHSIKYRVPGRYALFNIYNRKKMQFLNREQMLEIWEDLKRGKILLYDYEKRLARPLMFPVPRIALVKDVPMESLVKYIGISAYAIDEKGQHTFMEGIVIKHDRIQFYFEFRPGKIVREEFEKGITVNYRDLPYEENIIDPSVPLILNYP